MEDAIEQFTHLTNKVFQSRSWQTGSDDASRTTILEEELMRVCEEELGSSNELLYNEETDCRVYALASPTNTA